MWSTTPAAQIYANETGWALAREVHNGEGMTSQTFRLAPAALVFVTAAAVGCDLTDDSMSGAEMRAALEEVVIAGEASALQDGVVEITTSFTIADGVEAVLDEVRTFAETQIPCSTVTATGDKGLRIDFGELGDTCVYNGHTYAGVVTVSFEVMPGQVIVTHQYDGLTNGSVTMDGTATVTWADGSRRVQTDFGFAKGARMVTVESDRLQTPLGGLGDGILVDGRHSWTGASGTWDLEVDDVEIRGVDPVPQAGAYNLTNPDGKQVSMSFARVDDDTIAVTLAGPRRDRTFHVTSAGSITDE